MAQFDNNNEKFEPEGLLSIQEENELFQGQFFNWMEKKGVAISSGGEKNAILTNIIQSINKNDDYQEFQDTCFSKDSFDKGGGYDKSGFDKICI